MSTRGVSRILVPIDFSPASTAALTYGKLLAATFGASLHLLHVIDAILTGETSATKASNTMVVDVDAACISDAGTRLCNLLSGDEVKRFRASSKLVFGTTALSITKYATEHGMDLIVMGTNGCTRLADAVIGSVAERVVRTATCPVLTVRVSGAVKLLNRGRAHAQAVVAQA